MFRNFLFFLSFFSFPLFAEVKVTEEIAIIDNLITTTKKSVALQEKIKQEIIYYQKINKAFLENPKDPDFLFQMLRTAGPLFKNLQATHLLENFPSDFISELKLFSEIDSKGK